MDLDEPFLTEVNHCMTEILGRDPVIAANPVGSDTRVTVLYGNIPTVNIGPDGAGGHALNEWVGLDSYNQTIEMTALIMMRWCGIAS